MVLERLQQAARARLEAQASLRRFLRGEALLLRGDPGTSLMILKSGRAEISVTSAGGQKTILGVAEPEAILGDIACLDGGPRSADVFALEEASALVISRQEILRMLREDSESALLVIEALCEKARNASEMLEVKSLGSGAARLATCLLRLIEDGGGAAARDRVKVSQSWLGNYAGLTRENVNRQLRAWQSDGVAQVERGEIVILNHDALADIALEH
ncbi:Crp/Fnr family transcriptional regulator [Poseidonocella sedimentorum]|uniref:cAMP-binding domain of CRP or a regulatory subunit of cAMP-dependent protein kinases n=1 Tax=Poseidonocella sedimentorum TaxID=871652 RepID=A0A1I6DFC8_9RHOB|nr:Crp/Fnr family transcriptional regulator [Poseidonocella sedimentorum]SFR04155.1 cAMP-binding domain of CRP or a regulatory subunit of cAMP-dependent protein kinases [Poseidonocella sedimentorum]